MKQKNYLNASAFIFAVIAIGHIVRVFKGLHAAIGDTAVPMWASWVALLVAGYLAYQGYTLSKK